jgi:hypothetical protein
MPKGEAMASRNGHHVRLKAFVLLVAMALVGALAMAQPASAALLERCSGPAPTGPDGKDTFRVCINWDSAVVRGYLRYFPNPDLSPVETTSAVWLERAGVIITAAGDVKVSTIPYSVELPPAGNLSGGQAYVVRGYTNWVPTTVLSTPLVVA